MQKHTLAGEVARMQDNGSMGPVHPETAKAIREHDAKNAAKGEVPAWVRALITQVPELADIDPAQFENEADREAAMAEVRRLVTEAGIMSPGHLNALLWTQAFENKFKRGAYNIFQGTHKSKRKHTKVTKHAKRMHAAKERRLDKKAGLEAVSGFNEHVEARQADRVRIARLTLQDCDDLTTSEIWTLNHIINSASVSEWA